jgi:hypothetical protein
MWHAPSSRSRLRLDGQPAMSMRMARRWSRSWRGRLSRTARAGTSSGLSEHDRPAGLFHSRRFRRSRWFRRLHGWRAADPCHARSALVQPSPSSGLSHSGHNQTSSSSTSKCNFQRSRSAGSHTSPHSAQVGVCATSGCTATSLCRGRPKVSRASVRQSPSPRPADSLSTGRRDLKLRPAWPSGARAVGLRRRNCERGDDPCRHRGAAAPRNGAARPLPAGRRI